MAADLLSSVKDILPPIKIVCDTVALNPSKESLERHYSVIKAVDPEVITKLDFYILYPLCIHLSQKKKEETSCLLLNSVLRILKLMHLSSLDAFLKLYYSIIYQVQDIFEIQTTSEERKMLILQTLMQLIRSSSQDILKEFFTRKYYGKLSAGIYVCTMIAKVEKYIALKVEALKCLMYLTQVKSKSLNDKEYKGQIVNNLTLMLPGLMSTCLEIIKSAETQNHQVIIFALRLWARVLILATEEAIDDVTDVSRVNTIEDDKEKSLKGDVNRREEFLSMLLCVKRDKKWFEDTDTHLRAVTEIITKTHVHQHWKVRQELAESSFLVLQHSGKNLPSSVGYLVEVLAVLSQDDESLVAMNSARYINQLCQKCENGNDKSFVEIVEENFFSLLTRFPRIMHGNDVTRKEATLMVFCGYLDILGEKHLPALLSSVQHYNRFIHCLLVSNTPDCSSVTLLEEISLRDLSSSSFSNEFKWRCLKNCETERCTNYVKKLCNKFITLCDKELLLSSLLDEFNSNSNQRRAVTLLLVNMISSVPPGDLYSYSYLIKELIDALMEPSLWNVPIYIGEEGITKQTVQENVIQICLLADAVGSLAVATGLENFPPLLFQCLYPVLECAGSPINIIATSGRCSIQKLSTIYKENVATLIAKNVDYLSHHVTLKLRQAHRNPRVLSVLSVIMEYSTRDMLSSLHDIINDVLVQSCDLFQDINAVAFLHVFETYLSCILRCTGKEVSDCESEIKDKKSETKNEKSEPSWLKKLIEYNENLISANDFTEEKVSDLDIGQMMLKEKELEADQKEPEKPPLPDHIKMTIEVLKRSLHFLPGNDLSRQILCLQILDKGVFILSHWKDELLPIVHKIWGPLVERFKSSNHPLLLQRAFLLLISLAKFSREFIRARSLKDVLPSLNYILRKSSKESKNKSPKGSYVLTQAYKLQLLLLCNLGQVSLDLELPSKDIHTLLQTSTPYLSSKQPVPLREACVNMYIKLCEVYSDIVWVHLMTIHPYQTEIKSSVVDFPVYRFEVDKSEDTKEYMKSAKELYDILLK